MAKQNKPIYTTFTVKQGIFPNISLNNVHSQILEHIT